MEKRHQKLKDGGLEIVDLRICGSAFATHVHGYRVLPATKPHRRILECYGNFCEMH